MRSSKVSSCSDVSSFSCAEAGQELHPQVFLTGLRDLAHLDSVGGGDELEYASLAGGLEDVAAVDFDFEKDGELA